MIGCAFTRRLFIINSQIIYYIDIGGEQNYTINSQLFDRCRKACAMKKEIKKNAYMYCKFREEQYALYDEYCKRNGTLMKSFLILNALYYAKDGMTQKKIRERTFNSKQTVNLIVKGLLSEGDVEMRDIPENKKNKLVIMTDQGREKYKAIVTHITWAEDKAMSMLSDEEQKTLVDLSSRFTQNLIRLVNEGDNSEYRKG